MLSPRLLTVATLWAAAAGAQAPGRQTVSISRLDARVVVDGVLDEPAWTQAAVLDGFHQYQPVDGQAALERTEVLVWYAPDALMVGIKAHAANVATLRATLANRDKIANDDRIILYIDTFNDRRRAFMFGVNALGVQLDGVRTEGAASAANIYGGSIDYSPDFYYESKGRVTADGYVVEIRIPFKSLRFPGTRTQEWGFNVHRFSPSTAYEDTWTDVRRAGASFLGQGGALTGLHDLERGVVTEVQPFVTGNASGQRGTDGQFVRGHLNSTTGANVRLGFTQVSLDATLNPDFSQVESDAGLVTVNERFALYVPEKRPFFLEGIELFATPNQLIYTRQMKDPSVGGKVTGKLGAYSVALLSASDHLTTDNAQFTIGRVRRDLGGDSNIGLAVTDREAGGAYNRVAAADARIVYKKLYYLEAQIGSARTRDRNGMTRDGAIWKLENDRTGRHWGYNIQWIDIARGFESQAGFVPRTGITSFHWFNRLSAYGGKGALVEQISFNAFPSRIWRSAGALNSAPIEGSDQLMVWARLRGGWDIRLNAARAFYTVDPSAYASYSTTAAGPVAAPYRVATRQTGLADLSAQVSTPVLPWVNAEFGIERRTLPIFAEGSRGNDLRLSAGVSLRPTAAVRVEGTLATSHITRVNDGSVYANDVIPRVKVEYQLTRAMFFRVVSEYHSRRLDALRGPDGRVLYIAGTPSAQSESSRLRLDWLMSYQPVPGTVAFLGYGTGMDAPRSDAYHTLRRSDDTFFVKLAYQFRR